MFYRGTRNEAIQVCRVDIIRVGSDLSIAQDYIHKVCFPQEANATIPNAPSISRKDRQTSPASWVSNEQNNKAWKDTNLVTRNVPAALRNKLLGTLVNVWSRGSNLVLGNTCQHIKIGLVEEAVRTTVRSTNGLASSIFLSVLSKSFNSRSTTSFVSSADFTACASKASIALSCLPMS